MAPSSNVMIRARARATNTRRKVTGNVRLKVALTGLQRIAGERHQAEHHEAGEHHHRDRGEEPPGDKSHACQAAGAGEPRASSQQATSPTSGYSRTCRHRRCWCRCQTSGRAPPPASVPGRAGVRLPVRSDAEARRTQYSPLITKYEPRIVPASFDFCLANLNEPSSAGTSIPSESLNPTARFFGSPS